MVVKTSYYEGDATIGPSKFVNKWHNNGEEFEYNPTPEKYEDSFKKYVCDECVEHNIKLAKAVIKFNVPRGTLKNWFTIHDVPYRRKKNLRERVNNLKKMGYKTSYIAKELGMDKRLVRNYYDV